MARGENPWGKQMTTLPGVWFKIKNVEKGVHPTPEPAPPDSSGLQSQGELYVLPRRYMGVPCKQIPATQEDVSEQGAASRPDTCGDVPSPEDGGGNVHPTGGSMATWMEDEQNLSTRRGWHGAKVSQPWPRPEGGSQGDAPGRGESGPSPEAVRGPRAGEKGAAPGGGNRGPPPYGRLRRGRPSI